ncbi:hypothetical protein [Enterococcus phage vB_Efm3_KEN20]
MGVTCTSKYIITQNPTFVLFSVSNVYPLFAIYIIPHLFSFV